MTSVGCDQYLLRALDETHAKAERIGACEIGEEIVTLIGEIKKDNWESKAAAIIAIEQRNMQEAVEITVEDGYSVIVGASQRILVCDASGENYQMVAAQDLKLNLFCQVVDCFDYFEHGLYGDSAIVGLRKLDCQTLAFITTPQETHLVCNNIVV